ncbi:MAG: AP2 domain-containing protein [Verrucomicrobiota bacterium]
MSKNRNITRIEIDRPGANGTRGWEVRMRRRGQNISKFFSDRAFGGKRAALISAREYRDEVHERLRPVDRVSRMKQVTTRNSSGVAGVRLRENVVVKNGWQYTYRTWEASWTPTTGGRRVKRQFSVLKYGEDGAYALAVRARRSALRKMKREGLA